MANLIEKMLDSKFSRRDFLKGTLAASASVAGLSMAVCAKESSLVASASAADAESTAPAEHPAPVNPEEGGKWIPAACWHNCGGRCVNKVMVKDGLVVRQKTDDSHEDSWDYPQQRGCVRGKAQQQQCFGADRLKYPMKRKNWQPGDPHGELRGKDEWERISWDEAVKYVADEFKRIKESYGNQAFLVGNYGSFYSAPLLNAYGGHTSTTDSTSHGTYNMNCTDLGISSLDTASGNDRYDMLNADYIVLQSSNPAVSTAGNPLYHYLRAKEAGVKFITIDPNYTESAQALDAKWIPIRTGTDTAFMIGVAHEMLRLDAEEGDIVDWDFLNKYTVGFDAEHKPEALQDDVNFMDYLAGKYDGVEKTKEWASKISGVSVEDIEFFARVLGKKNNVWYMHNYGMARCHGAENVPQMFMTLGCMGGHIGKAGNCTGGTYHANAGNTGPALVKAGGSGLPTLTNEVDGIIPGPQVWDAVLTGKYRFIGSFYTGHGSMPAKDCTCDIHCIFHDENAYLQTGPNMKKGIEAHRKVDFVVSKAQFLTTQAKYSDIVLPVTTQWEVLGGLAASNREFLYCFSKVTEPLYEAKTDREINSLILTELGVDPAVLYPISEAQAFYNSLKGCTVMNDNGEYEPLLTITDDDIKAWGVEGEPQEGRIALQDFIDNGGYQVERKSGDKQSEYKSYSAFIADPEANPLGSVSGKFEICCQAKADNLNNKGFSDHVYAAYPEYLVPELGYETTFKGGDLDSEKGEFPYLLYNPHYMRRSHTVFNNCPWLREAWPNPVYLNASDAKEKGIENGDTVRVWTKYGEVLRKASCMETLMPGHVGIPHGSWVNVDEETGIDHGGADNYLIGNDIYGSGVTGYNNCNCNYEKYTGEPIDDDVYTDSRIINLD